MKRRLDVVFVEEEAVEIQAVNAGPLGTYAEEMSKGIRREFWLGWQLFRAEW